MYVGFERKQQRRGVGMRLGEAEIPAERAGRAHAHIGDVALHLGQHGTVLARLGGVFHRPVCHRRADVERAVADGYTIKLRDSFHVDQVLVTQQVVLHREEQLGAAGVEPAVLAVMRQHLGGFLDVFRLIDLEASKWHHNRSRYLFSLSLSARQTRSGVSGAWRMRTPVARATALAMFAAMELSEPSPPPFAPYGPTPSWFSTKCRSMCFATSVKRGRRYSRIDPFMSCEPS